MPDVDGRLSKEEKDVAVAWFGKHAKSPLICAVCGSTEWMLADHVVSPLALGGSTNVRLSGPGYPQIMLISDPCGHTIYVNAISAGVVQRDSVPAPAPVLPPSAPEG